VNSNRSLTCACKRSSSDKRSCFFNDSHYLLGAVVRLKPLYNSHPGHGGGQPSATVSNVLVIHKRWTSQTVCIGKGYYAIIHVIIGLCYSEHKEHSVTTLRWETQVLTPSTTSLSLKVHPSKKILTMKQKPVPAATTIQKVSKGIYMVMFSGA
jgi:hypothetical protein